MNSKTMCKVASVLAVLTVALTGCSAPAPTSPPAPPAPATTPTASSNPAQERDRYIEMLRNVAAATEPKFVEEFEEGIAANRFGPASCLLENGEAGVHWGVSVYGSPLLDPNSAVDRAALHLEETGYPTRQRAENPFDRSVSIADGFGGTLSFFAYPDLTGLGGWSECVPGNYEEYLPTAPPAPPTKTEPTRSPEEQEAHDAKLRAEREFTDTHFNNPITAQYPELDMPTARGHISTLCTRLDHMPAEELVPVFLNALSSMRGAGAEGAPIILKAGVKAYCSQHEYAVNAQLG